MSRLVTLATLFALALPAGAFAQAGTLDTTFSVTERWLPT